MKRRSVALGCAAAALLFAYPFIGRAVAQDYPQRPVTFVVPYPPGGGVDLLTRLLADGLTEQLKQPVVIENRPGAGTLIGAGFVAKSKPDGYTLLLAPVTTLAINPSVYKTLPYDPVKDFAPITLVGQAQFALIANPSLGAKTLPDLIAIIKSKPGEMSYGSAGTGTPHQLFMEMFLKMAGGLKMQHVPYRGSVAALTDVISNQIPMMMVDLAPSLQHIQDGKVKAYGVTSPTRVKAAPEIPTIAEAGLPGYAATGWLSMVARAGTPAPIIERLNRIVVAYLKRPEVEGRLQAIAIPPITSTPTELETFIGSEIVKWAKVVKDAGIEPQ